MTALGWAGRNEVINSRFPQSVPESTLLAFVVHLNDWPRDDSRHLARGSTTLAAAICIANFHVAATIATTVIVISVVLSRSTAIGIRQALGFFPLDQGTHFIRKIAVARPSGNRKNGE